VTRRLRARAFLFDLDGTLVDSLADIAAAMNHALIGFGWPVHDHAAYRGFVGEGVEALARRAAPAGAQERHAELIAAYQHRYGENLLDATRPYPGVVELVASLRARGVPLGVLSNKPDRPTRHLAEALFPAGSFAAVQGQLPGVPRKPDPTAALALAATLGHEPRDIAFVGDTAVDVHTARAAGMLPIGVGWGFRAAELSAAGAALVVERAEELLALVA
jgi:phosphoglycolate phosphatase